MSVEVDGDSREMSAVRRLRPSGNSVVISMPPELLDLVGLSRDDHVRIVASFDDDVIVMRKTDPESDSDGGD
jgi:antitoxin component of MazEF toxin-antitoxin module